MSLDQNLFTLIFTVNKDDPNAVDLVDPSGTVHYRKHRMPGSVYTIHVTDPLTDSLLASATAPSATSKHKTLELHNPTAVVELKYTGTLSFRWGFKWEDHEFEWKREECYMLRKPDPPVLIAVTKEPPGRLKTINCQILDYNLHRFDIDDRKGLEVVLLTALMTFHDANVTHHSRDDSTSTPPVASRNTSDPLPAPTRPPKPAPKTGVERIKEIQAARGEFNEIVVEAEGSVKDYARHCIELFSDEAMLFITLQSSSAAEVPKVLQVVEQIKRMRQKSGIPDSDELQQYVLYDNTTTASPDPVPSRSKGKDTDKAKEAPTTLTVHLSKIPMPELQPRARPVIHHTSKPLSPPHWHSRSDIPDGNGTVNLGKPEKGKTKKDKDRDRDDAKKHKTKSKTQTGPDAGAYGYGSPATGSLHVPLTPPARMSLSNGPVHVPIPTSSVLPPRTHSLAHQIPAYQLSPSPSQLNNPGMYVAPPSPRPPQGQGRHGILDRLWK